MKTLKMFILITILTFRFAAPILKASDTVGTTIEITEDAINLFINDQYNRTGFPTNISGSVGGVTYDITLNLPKITLLDNQAQITFGFKIVSNIFNGTVVFNDVFTFSVPSIDNLTVNGVSQHFKIK